MRAFTVATLFAATSAMAFAPGGFKFFPGTKTHKEISEDGIQLIYADLGLSDITKSMKEARKQIADANAQVDVDDEHNAPSHFDGESFSEGQLRLKTLVDEVVTKLNADDALGARLSVGRALHTVQDFYAHSNWVELGNATPSTEIARTLGITNAAPPAFATCVDAPAFNACSNTNLLGSFLTSGYYAGEGRDKPPGKCRHGGFFDGSPGRGGINKDSAICAGITSPGIFDSPHNDSNAMAASVATDATAQIFRDIRGRVNERQFKALLGVGPSLAFAIDTTNSMGSIIAGVRNTAITIVNGRLGTPDEPSKYILSPFDDPGVGPLTVTDDADLFKTRISALVVSPPGIDCPELSMAGTLNAVSASDNGGDVLIFTDASAKDAALAGSVSSLATSKKVRTFFMLFGSCSPFDPAYFSVANSTGGQVFILNRTEAGTVTQLANLLARNTAVDILSINDTLTGAKSISVPVDSELATVTFSFSRIDTATFTLRRPDGGLVSGTDPDVTFISLSNGSILSIKTPAAGAWTINLAGSGVYSVLVTAEGALALDEFGFVTGAGRPGHQGLYPIPGLPAPAALQKAQLKISGSAFSPRLEFRDNAGFILSTFFLNDIDVEQGRLMGDVVTPVQSFKAYLAGTDKSGFAFQRVIATSIVPQPVSIVAPAAVDLGQGQLTTFFFQVRNDGPPDTFSFAAVDTARFVTSISPPNAAIATGATVQVRVQLLPPVGSTIGLSDTLTFTASSTTRSDVRNFAILKSSVVAAKMAGDVNRDNVLDCNDLRLVRASLGTRAGQPGFNPDVDIDSNGIIDIRDMAFVAQKLPVGSVCK
jgi:hypothetical protein